MSPADYKAAREKLGLTQAGLAARLVLPRTAIVKREAGDQRITEEAALALRALDALRRPEDGWRADAAEKCAAEAEAAVRRMRELLEDVLDGSVDASTYPDGPCLDRDVRMRIKAELPNAKIRDGEDRDSPSL